MGWSDCGEVIYKGKARRIGYGVSAKCDGGCGKTIDRGLGYACGGMHGNMTGRSCEGYFCAECLGYNPIPHEDEDILADVNSPRVETISVCPECYQEYLLAVKAEKALLKSLKRAKAYKAKKAAGTTKPKKKRGK